MSGVAVVGMDWKNCKKQQMTEKQRKLHNLRLHNRKAGGEITRLARGQVAPGPCHKKARVR